MSVTKMISLTLKAFVMGVFFGVLSSLIVKAVRVFCTDTNTAYGVFAVIIGLLLVIAFQGKIKKVLETP